MLAASGSIDLGERLVNVMPTWQGAYSLVIIAGTKVVACRGPWGFRPLSIGKLASGGHVVASETGALETLGCKAIREIEPGEVVMLQGDLARSTHALGRARRRAARSSTSTSPARMRSGTA
ncbi:MAG: hypothetical protein R2710_16205 [Acidimicrobiales bacterium]